MEKSVHVLIIGGSISGLTLANLLIHAARNCKFRVSIFEAQPSCSSNKESIGGGLGIWPPSQSVLRNIPGLYKVLEQVGYYMPLPSYRDDKGRILASAAKDFNDLFPVLCLDRNDLLKLLLTNLESRDDVDLITSQKIYGYEKEQDKIVVTVDNGRVYKGDLLVACDGIHSSIRGCLMSELKLPPVLETDLGYTYFRATAQVPVDSNRAWWSTTFETWGTCKSKKFGTHEIRFGYVPLKPPHVFWFIAISTEKGHKFLSPTKGVKLIDEDTKEFLIELVKSFQPIRNESAEVLIDYEELILLTVKILRTDIAKVNRVEKFPWVSKDKRIVLMGDAAHATAPNIAQGAGLCIEDAACLASLLNRVDYLEGLSEYEQARKPRAKVVQQVADTIAAVGQEKMPLIKSLRNCFMRVTTILLPKVQQHLFNYLVSYSLGGSKELPYWQAPRLSNMDDLTRSLFGRVFANVHELDTPVKDFKTSAIGGRGLGIVTVEKPSVLAKLFGALVHFPKVMHQQPFYAEVTNLSPGVQRWKRVFGYNTPQQKTYSTTHSTYCDLNRRLYLSEGVGGCLDRMIRFIYTITQQADKSLKYQSQGAVLFNKFKLLLPAFLLPKSEWIETPTKEGWEFDGKVSFPIVGMVLHYYGTFEVAKTETVKGKRIIIAGGSGMIGKAVCAEFIKKGYDVYCLSRFSKTRINIEGVKVRCIDEQWSDLIDSSTIILNLSGANPGFKRWTSSAKSEIVESRYRAIDTIIRNIEKANEKPLKYLQASAAGIYGDAADVMLTEQSEPKASNDPGTTFRVEVCKEIERRAASANCNVVNLRIGHVLSNAGGLLPYFRLSGIFSLSRFGAGNQFVPFVHIDDVAKAIEFIASSESIVDGVINITAPKPCRNSEFLKDVRLIKSGVGIPVSKSILKLLVGESSVVLTDSERVHPARLLESGFKFQYDTINKALCGLK